MVKGVNYFLNSIEYAMIGNFYRECGKTIIIVILENREKGK